MAAMIKLWHDDIRRPPDDSWEWARTNQEAQMILTHNKVSVISMDHDLGLLEMDPDADPPSFAWRGFDRENTGLDLVNWMIEANCVPRRVVIHSWNPDGAKAMAARLNYHGYDCFVSVYIPPTVPLEKNQPTTEDLTTEN